MAVPSFVPAQYQGDVSAASQATGLPASVVAWQIQDESSFNPKAVSPTGAQGIAQFEPGTWKTYGKGSPFNPSQAFAAYSKFMSHLLKVEGGSVFKALEAYNAGEGNLPAGRSYATHILTQAGLSQSITATPGGVNVSPSDTTGLSLNPFSPLTSAFGTSLGELIQRLGLILLGGGLVILGLYVMNEKRLKAVVRTGAEAAMVAK